MDTNDHTPKTVLIALTQGKFAVVDAEDEPLVRKFNWRYVLNRKTKTTYAYTGAEVIVKMHDLIMNPGVGDLVDHKDSNGLNNSRSNLRVASKEQNNWNSRARANNSTGVKGVGKKHGATFQARITCKGKTIHLGSFATQEQASAVYDKAAHELFGRFARPNAISPSGSVDVSLKTPREALAEDIERQVAHMESRILDLTKALGILRSSAE